MEIKGWGEGGVEIAPCSAPLTGITREFAHTCKEGLNFRMHEVRSNERSWVPKQPLGRLYCSCCNYRG